MKIKEFGLGGTKDVPLGSIKGKGRMVTSYT